MHYLVLLAALIAAVLFSPAVSAVEVGFRTSNAIDNDGCAERRYYSGGITYPDDVTPGLLQTKPQECPDGALCGGAVLYAPRHYRARVACRVEAYGLARIGTGWIHAEVGAGRNAVGHGSAYGLALATIAQGKRWMAELGAGLAYDRSEQWRVLARFGVRRMLGQGWTLGVDVEPERGYRSAALGLSLTWSVRP